MIVIHKAIIMNIKCPGAVTQFISRALQDQLSSDAKSQSDAKTCFTKNLKC